MTTASAQLETDAPELSPSQEASQGTSLEDYRAAKRQEADKPELAKPFPVEVKTVETKAAEQPRTISKRQQQINDYERTVAELRAENAKLKAAPAAPVVQPAARREPEPEPARVPAVAPKTADQDAYDRYLAMPDAPTMEAFSKAGKTYEQFTAAMQIFIADKRDAEREQRTRQHETETQVRERERTRATKVQTAFNADPDIAGMFETIKATGQYPVNGPISQDVLNLRPFSALGPNEQPTALNAIAEELLESDHPVALARHLSKPGELARLAALPDARSLLRAIRDIERDLTTPRPVKTQTQAGDPADVLTSARASNSLDPVEAALRSGDQAAYKAARMAERLRAKGLTK